MKRINLIMFISILYLMAFAACRKTKENVNAMHQPSQSGANILAVKINGVAHIYQGKYDGLPGLRFNGDNGVALDTIFYDNNWRLMIHAVGQKYDDDIRLWVFVPGENNGFKPPQLNVPYQLSNTYDYSTYSAGNGAYPFRADTNASTIIFTRFDSDVAAGKFEFYGYNKNNENVSLTEGFFDISNR